MKFKHLVLAKQTYFEHFKDSISYSYKAFKASLFFLSHSIIPDLFEKDGSDIIKELNDLLQEKIRKIIEQQEQCECEEIERDEQQEQCECEEIERDEQQEQCEEIERDEQQEQCECEEIEEIECEIDKCEEHCGMTLD